MCIESKTDKQDQHKRVSMIVDRFMLVCFHQLYRGKYHRTRMWQKEVTLGLKISHFIFQTSHRPTETMWFLNFFISTLMRPHFPMRHCYDALSLSIPLFFRHSRHCYKTVFRNITIRCHSCPREKVQQCELFKDRSRKWSRFPEGSC